MSENKFADAAKLLRKLARLDTGEQNAELELKRKWADKRAAALADATDEVREMVEKERLAGG